MKAVISDTDPDRLELRLVAEGGNDLVLMRILERQYPAIGRLSHDNLLVPVLSTDALRPNPDNFSVATERTVSPGVRVMLTSDPWPGGLVADATLVIAQPHKWVVWELVVSDRTLFSCPGGLPQQSPLPGTRLGEVLMCLRPGAVIKITAEALAPMCSRPGAGPVIQNTAKDADHEQWESRLQVQVVLPAARNRTKVEL